MVNEREVTVGLSTCVYRLFKSVVCTGRVHACECTGCVHSGTYSISNVGCTAGSTVFF